MSRLCRRCGGTGQEPDLRPQGDALRRAREALGLSLRELARRADVSPSYVSDVEYGRRGNGGPALARIRAVLGGAGEPPRLPDYRCIICRVTPVAAEDGYDTCPACVSRA